MEFRLIKMEAPKKSFTIANVIKEVNKKILVLAHNKTLVGQII